ncbi:N-acetylmuramoyl-L-alanine amidase family protein [Rhizomicrobium electricum]|uniref:N-acetylmuramoyl-L-alanine amidase n=1 Tax=Rhizomicrobium electricum TaxID=480070 RepID=A0ABN1F6M0_9PROT|nr:N-acetylmuramoyl-L-alanine amidase [Rhizomicrobium electricum]NIJ50425.1 N-acetylmuramoyl-L-alanine amidase [Rhizomicrobium electricum]
MCRYAAAILVCLFVGSFVGFRAYAGQSLHCDRVHDGRKLILIDPGHGGVDKGVTNKNGVDEKTLALVEAQTLSARLLQRGYSVCLTRKSDELLALNERLEIVIQAHPSLFISLHVNYSGDPSVSGASVYVYTNSESGSMLKEENIGTSNPDGRSSDAPSGFVTPTVSRHTANLSGSFAEKLTARLADVTNMLPNGSIRSARLSVLTTPEIPSVLLEMGFLSNNAEAARLKSASWRAALTDAIANSVDDYFHVKQNRGGRSQ